MNMQSLIFRSFVILSVFTALVFAITACNPDRDKLSVEEMMKRERSDDLQTERRIDSLLDLMTLEEKAGQMLHLTLVETNMDSNAYSENYPRLDSQKVIRFAEKFGIGFLINDMAITEPKWISFMNELQGIYMRHSRLKIPYIYAICHQHGASFLIPSTIFPHNLTLAASFDTLHAMNMARVTILETAHLGHNFIYVPVVDIGRNPRWSRFYETFGESFLLCSEMGKAMVHGIQENPQSDPWKVAACAKHFIGYSDPRSGFDRTPAVIPDQELFEFYIPSFKACIDAGVKIVEINSSEVNGIPVHASRELVTELLRGKLGFKGVVNSDWQDIKMLVTHHKVAANEKEATLLGLEAGLDCILTPEDDLFAQYTCELVREGKVSEARIDLSVRRILRLKFELGLFDGNFRVEARPENIRSEESVEQSKQAARESLVLLKNKNDVLPLNTSLWKRILVAGPNANSKASLTGAWTIRWNYPGEQLLPPEMKTVYQAICDQFKDIPVRWVESVQSYPFRLGDILIYVAGEKPYAEVLGSIPDMSLPEDQRNELEILTEKRIPVVVIMNAGRPRILGDLYDMLDAFIWAGLPGMEGGTALAELLSGKINPCGKLPFAYPNAISHIIPYNHKNSEAIQSAARGLKTCMADFGEGLSYTRFLYDDLVLSDTLIRNTTDKLMIRMRVTNIGKREGKEAVLFFLSDEVASITRPVRELKYFRKINLKPGESREVKFFIDPLQHLSFPDAQGKPMLEDGYFHVQVGSHTARFRLMRK